MTYLVEVTSRAERDLCHLYEEKHAADSEYARKWYVGLRAAVLGLGKMPDRCSITPENRRLRHLLYGTKPHVYRVIFRVAKKARRVEVLHIRHGSRRSFRNFDLR